jgi:hypothetical protein
MYEREGPLQHVRLQLVRLRELHEEAQVALAEIISCMEVIEPVWERSRILESTLAPFYQAYDVSVFEELSLTVPFCAVQPNEF